eukprot:TRINITY_DN13229_c0_g2_i17.p1 TRINITY_DN13229_c0_g2~~TRINITY_DN13229_c0_g2_i17.p1  ORF type:complete len:1073 (-),score=93.84 TRINITY_DN13229_c0_g2_i17:399-3617(-)
MSSRPFSHVLCACVLAVCSLEIAVGVELRLGGAVSLSGPYASVCKQYIQGWDLWAQRVNELGGLKISDGQVVTVKRPMNFMDDKSDDLLGRSVLQNMLNASHPDHADLHFVIGPYSSGQTAWNLPVAERAGKILLSGGAADSLYSKGSEFIFSTLTPASSYLKSGLQMLRRRGAKTTVFMHEDKLFSSSVCEGGNVTARNLGMDVLAYVSYPAGSQTQAAMIHDFKVKAPDVIVGCGHFEDIGYIVSLLVLMDVNPKALLLTVASDERIIRTLRSKSHAILSPTQWHRDLQYQDDDGFFGSANDFAERYQKTFDEDDTPYYAAYSAALGYALGKAIEVAGSLDTDDVREALYSLRLQSFYGPIRFSGSGHHSGLLGAQPDRPMATTQILDRKVSVVAPEEGANAAPEYPAPTWADKDLVAYPCQLGEEEASHGCSPCNVGHYRDANLLSCKPCPVGSYAETERASKCHLCPVGTHASSAGLSSCAGCPQGRYMDAVGKTECKDCGRGRFAITEGRTMCDSCSTGTYASLGGMSGCTPCPNGFSTNGEAAATFDHCVCEEGTFLQSRFNDSGRCGRCMWGFTTAGVGATSKDDCTVNSLHVVIVALILVVLGFPPLVAYLIHRHYKRSKAAEALMRSLSMGFRSIETLQFPLCVVSSHWFCQLDEACISEMHEGARKGGHIVYLDCEFEVETFKDSGKKILFFSYHWLSWYRSGPSLLQLECMQAAAKETCRQNNLELSDLYIWLDVLSIPQRNDVCKKLAIDSLYGYASSADFLVAICPESLHEQTGEIVGIGSYKSRVWCRVEQMAHCCCKGFRNMAYSVERGRLVPMDEEWLRSVMYIFEGQMTCCRLRHADSEQCDQELLVPTMLAMYARMFDNVFGTDKEEVQTICNMMDLDRDRVFPRRFVFVTNKGKHVQRQLFGPLIGLIKDYAMTAAGREVLRTLSTRSEPSRGSEDGDDHQTAVSTPSRASGSALMLGRALSTDTGGGFCKTDSACGTGTSSKMRGFFAMLPRSGSRHSLSAAEVISREVARRNSSHSTRRSTRVEAPDERGHVLRTSATDSADNVYPVKLSI